MSVRQYLRLVVWEYLLTCVAGTALTYVMLDSFYINPSIQYSPLPGIAAVLLLTALFAAAFNRASARVGGVLIALCCIVALGVAIALSPEAFLADTEENYFYVTLVCVLVPLLVFGLARSHVGAVVLFAVGAFVCAWMEFFYEFDELAWTLAFILSSLMLVVYKNYLQNARSATSVRKLSFSAGFLVACGVAGAGVGVACLVWVLVIAPLNPGVLDIKLIQEYRALETLLVIGTSDEQMMPDMDLTSDQTIDLERTVDDLEESDDGIQMPAKASSQTTTEEQKSGTFLGFDVESITEVFNTESYEQDLPWWLFLVPLLLVLLAVVAYFVGRRVWRNLALRHMRGKPLAAQIEAIYLCLAGKLERLGFAVPAGATLLEFAGNNEESLREFKEVSGVSYATLTATYVGSVYGHQEVTQEQADQFACFYKGFWKAARKKIGNVKYFFKSFRL